MSSGAQQSQLATFGIKVSKKISLKHFEFPNDLTAEVKHGYMNTISNGLDTIFSSYPDYQLCIEMLYRSVEMLCKYNHGRAIYDQVNRAIEGYCVRELKPLVHNNPQHQSLSLAGNALAAWETLVEASFAYLFEVWTHNNGSFIGLRQLSSGHFRQHALGSKTHELVRLVNAKIGPGYPREDHSIKKLLAMLHQLNLMPQVMHSVQEALGKFPVLEGDLAQGFSVFQEFQTGFAPLLPSEEYRQEYFGFVREKYLQKYVGLFEKWTSLVIAEGLQKEFMAMAHISKACDKVNEFVIILKSALKEFVRRLILKVDLETPEKPITVLVRIMETFTQWISHFPYLSVDAVTEAVEAAINLNSELTAELLACYCNILLLSEKMSSEENYGDKTQQIRASLPPEDHDYIYEDVHDPLQPIKVGSPSIIQEVDKVISVLRLVHAKDHFELVYRRLFSRRMVSFARAGSPSVKGQVENYMIERLEKELGAAYVSKLKAIYREVCSDVEYEDINPGTFCFVPEGIWAFTLPTSCVEIKPQTAIDDGYESYSYWANYYREEKKILKLVDCLCTFEVYMELVNGPVTFFVSLPHAAILMLYRNQLRNMQLSVSELYKNSGITSTELFNRALKTLSSTKLPLLIKSENGYRVNHALQVFEKKIQIMLYSRKELLLMDCPLIGMVAAGSEMKFGGSEESVEPPVIDPALKGHQLEAAIVRILKKQKNMPTGDLKKAVQEVLTWRIDESDWKRHLESLQEREFIKITAETISYIL